MGQDVQQVELQNKDMQIASGNQKVLASQLDQLMLSLKIPGYILETLKNEPLDQPDGVKECCISLQKLVSVLKKDFGEYKEMNVVKEKLSSYHQHALQFAKRLLDYLETFFKIQVIFSIYFFTTFITYTHTVV